MVRGSIRQHGKGWQIRYWYTDATGRRRQRGETVPTKHEAERLLRRRLDEEEKGQVVSRKHRTLASYLEYWLEHFARPNLRALTVEKYEGYIRRSIVPHLGHMDLQRITPTQIQQLYTRLLRQPLSSTTVRQIHAILSGALGQAVKWRLLSFNPVDGVTAPPVAHHEPVVWTADELDKFCQGIADHPFRPLFLTAICTGLRRSELVGARVTALDLPQGGLRVTSTLQRVRGKLLEEEPKNRKSRRLVRLGPALIDMLRAELGRRLLDGPASDYLFCNAEGAPLNADHVSHTFRETCIEIEVRPIRFQDLRHLHASLLLGSGEHLKVVSDRMGHSTITTTYDTYAHVMPDADRGAAETVERRVFGT